MCTAADRVVLTGVQKSMDVQDETQIITAVFLTQTQPNLEKKEKRNKKTFCVS